MEYTKISPIKGRERNKKIKIQTTDAFFMEYIMCHYLIFVPFGLCFDQLLFFVWIYNENCGVELLLYGANLTFEQGHRMVLKIHK
jgi:hypothetical protein